MAHKVLIPIDISPGGKEYLLERGYEITIGDGDEIDLDIVGDFDAILLRTSIVDKAVLDAAKKLKVIGRYGIGLDNIDMEACKERGIRVTYAPYANIHSVAEYALLMILQCAKNTHAVELRWRSPENDFNTRNTHCGFELKGSTLGIVGTGKTGSLVAEKALAAFDMEVKACDPFIAPEKRVPGVEYISNLEEMLPQVDILSLHIPLKKDTYHMISDKELALMKPSAWLCNCSRGFVVDEAALIKALEEKVIAGAALDVYEDEPNVWPNPLFQMENVIVSPHTAGMTVQSADRVGIHAAMGIHDVLSGREPQWPADR